MDQELVEMASTAAGQVVTLLTTDAWERVRSALGALWRRICPDQADAVEADLTQAREQLTAAGDSGAGGVAQLLLAEWQGRLWRLLIANPSLAAEISAMLAGELRSAGTYNNEASRISLRGHATGGGSVYQAGRDQTITVHDRSSAGSEQP